MAHEHLQRGGDDPVRRHRAAGKRTARCLVVTVSDTRTLENDESGATASERLRSAGHEVVRREIIPDERDTIATVVRRAIADGGIDAVVFPVDPHFDRLVGAR